MKVLAFNGSARENGNTYLMVEEVFKKLRSEGIECECIQMSKMKLNGCVACYKCMENKDNKCVFGETDGINEFIQKILKADALILASPTYFADVTANMKAFIERVGFVARANDFNLKRKLGASIVTVRRGGAIHTFDTLNHFFLISEMIIVGASYWNIGIGRGVGEVLQDEEGLKNMQNLGENLAWAMKRLNTAI